MKNVIIQQIGELFTQNLNSYPDSYPLTSENLATNEASESVADWAKNLFENRTELDRERDEQYNITITDYVEAAFSAFADSF